MPPYTPRDAPVGCVSHFSGLSDLLLDLFELVFAYAADGSDPIVGNILVRRSVGDASFVIADCGIVNPFAYDATVLFHLLCLFK